MTPHAQLYKEAAFVGIALVPMWYAVTQLTSAVKLQGPNKAWIDVALAGILFHLTAEESGLNTYYLTNSYASKKAFADEYKQEDALDLDGTVDWLHDAGNLFGF